MEDRLEIVSMVGADPEQASSSREQATFLEGKGTLPNGRRRDQSTKDALVNQSSDRIRRR